MARREIEGYKLASAQSLASTFTTSPVTVRTVDTVAFNVSTSGVTSNSGTFAVQHRMYKDANNFSAWATLSLSSTPTLTNADAQFLVSLNQVPPGQIQVVFTPGGATPNGTCDVWVSATSIGG